MMNLKSALGGSSSRRTSPDRAAHDQSDPDVHAKAPRRTGSFGKGLGTALASSMTRASGAVAGSKKSGSQTPTPGALQGAKEFPFPGGASAQAGSNHKGRSNGHASIPSTLDPSHLSNFSLKLSELVNQSLAPTVAGSQQATTGVASVTKHTTGRSSVPRLEQIVYEGQRLPNRAKVQEIAQLVTSELRHASGVDAYLLRAVSRASLKALTLFADRIDSLLIPAAKDPTLLIIPSMAKEGLHLSPALEYNLGLATITWVVEDALENCIEGDDRPDASPVEAEPMPPFVSEILTPVRKKMETTILHVIQPVLTGVKTSLTASILKGVRNPFMTGGSPALTPSVSLETPLPPASPGLASNSTLASPKTVEPLSPSSGNWLKELQGRLEGCRKLLVPRIEARTGQDGEGWFISVAIHLIWKGLFVLTSRTVEASSSCGSAHKVPSHSGVLPAFLNPGSHQALADAHKRSPSPGQISAALRSVANVGGGRTRRNETAAGHALPSTSNAASGRATPSDTVGRQDGTVSPAGGTQGKLFKSSASVKTASSSQTADLQALQKLSLRFCKGFVTDKAMAAVAAELSRADVEEDNDEEAHELEDEEDELARQALAEALEALNSTIAVAQALDQNRLGVLLALERSGGTRAGAAAQSAPIRCSQLRALRAIPPLLLLHLVYCRLPAVLKLPSGEAGLFLPSPPDLFGISWVEYERSISGFVGGSSWAQAAIARWQKAVEQLWGDLVAARDSQLTSIPQGVSISSQPQQVHTPEASNDGIDDLGTTPTPARLAAQAAMSRPGLEDRHPSSDSLATDAGRTGMPRASVNGDEAVVAPADDDAQMDGLRAQVVSPKGSDRSARSSTSECIRETPEASPRMRASDSVSSDDLASSTSSLSLAGTDSVRPSAKQRFWKSGSSSSQVTAGSMSPDAGSSTGRGFHLPSLPRPGFASRNSSPGGPPLGGPSGIGARSGRRGTAPSPSAAAAAAGTKAGANGEPAGAADSELVDLDRAQEALFFFAKVLEWAGWCAGMDVKCSLGDAQQPDQAEL